MRDKAYVVAIGVRLAVLDEESGVEMFPEYDTPIASIINFTISDDRQYVAISVKLKRRHDRDTKSNLNAATLLVYDSDTYLLPAKKPMCISYLDSQHGIVSQHFQHLVFFEDSQLIAAKVLTTIIVYDWRTSEIKYKIPEASEKVNRLSFYLGDWTKLAGMGNDNFLTVWRYSRNKIHAAPISSPQGLNCNFTCFAWINPDMLISGSNHGFLCAYSMKSCEFWFKLKAFDREEHIVSLLYRSEVCVVAGRSGMLSIFNVLVANTKDSPLKLTPIGIYTLPQGALYHNVQWCYLSNYLSHEVVISCSSSLSTYDLEITRLRHEAIDVSLGDSNGSPSGSRAQSPGTVERRASFISRKRSQDQGLLASDPSSAVVRRQIYPKSVLMSHHSGAVTALATAQRLNLLVSHSNDDRLIRVWQYKMAHNEVLLDHSYSQTDKLDAPLCLDSHPSGRMLALGCENDVQECVIADDGLVGVRRYPTRVAVTDPHGQPFANHSAVSIVVYSNGGHMLAAAAGKSVQVFHVNILDFASDKSGDQNSNILYKMQLFC